MASIGIALVTSAVTVYVRDFAQILPMAIQIGLFATPVAYPLSQPDPQPHPDRHLLRDQPDRAGARLAQDAPSCWASSPDWLPLGVGGASSFLMLTLGYMFFKRMETGIADIA